MIDIADLSIGSKVHYQPEHYEKEGKWKNGMVKEIREGIGHVVWVVYHCANNWHKYREYTGVMTNLHDLKLGWHKESQTLRRDIKKEER